MLTKILACLVLSCGLLALHGCKSKDEATDANHAVSAAPCTCGDPMTDMEGCACPKCSKGEHNPDNPNCVCGTYELEK